MDDNEYHAIVYGASLMKPSVKDLQNNKIKELENEVQRQIELRRIEWNKTEDLRNKFQALKSELKALLEKYE